MKEKQKTGRPEEKNRRRRGRGPLGCLAAASAVCTALLASPAMTLTSFADSEIMDVKLKFTIDGWDENGDPVISMETDSSKYSTNEFLTLEEYESEWSELNESEDDDDDEGPDESLYDYIAQNRTYMSIGDQSEILYAAVVDSEAEYSFPSDVRVECSGLGAASVEIERLNSNRTLAVYIKFAELDDQLGEAPSVSWGERGRASWEPAQGASVYELRLVNDTQGKTAAYGKQTGGTSYDFRPFMKEAGSYVCQVRPVSAFGDAGEWTESGAFSVSEQEAAANLAEYEVIVQTAASGPTQEAVYLNTGWQQGADGRKWYREPDGGYPQKNWQEDAGNWYFFDENGYMATDTYVKWKNKTYYVGADGAMAVNTQTPDGRIAQPDGTLKWPEM